MAELAKTHITVVDESTYATGVNTLIPLYVFATASNKVVDEATGEIALGTTKQFAGEVQIVTSQREVIDRYGVPYFAELNGTIQQGNERNEYGLYGLYDAMGTTSVAYALRADIDLGQLEPREAEPRGNVKNGTHWIDLTNSNAGLFRAKSAPSSKPSTDWEEYPIITFEKKKPLDTVGAQGNIAIVFEEVDSNNDGKTDYIKEVVYYKGVESWEVLGTSVDHVFKQTSIDYPTGYTAKDVWMKTTAINGGASYTMKRWVSSTETWVEEPFPVCTSFIDAEGVLGTKLAAGSLCFYFNKAEKNCNGIVYKYVPSDLGLSKSASSGLTVVADKALTLRYVEDGSLKTITVKMEANSTTDTIAAAFRKAFERNGSKAVTVISSANKLEIYSDTTDMEITGDYANFGFAEQDTGYQTAANVWVPTKDFIASLEAPTANADEGTLWFNDDLKVDIMVNNGQVWKGFNNADGYTNANIYVTSEDPTSTGVTVNANSLWIDTDEDSYPVIRKWVDNEWYTLDPTDQTTPNGIVFADARYYTINQGEYVDPTYEVNDDTGAVTCSLYTSDDVDPDCVNPQTYPAGIILFNTRFSTNNVKEYKENPFEGLYDENGDYTVGAYEGNMNNKATARWVTASGNAENGSGLFGAKAQRRMVVNAMAGAIKANENIRTYDYDFFFATAPGYPELDDELISLNVEKKEMFEIISDTPKALMPDASKIQAWATNANNAISHGAEGRVLKNTYVTRQYPPMGLTSNVDGNEVAVPTSIAKMKNLLVLPRGQIAAGTQYGQVTNLASVGFITDEDEYASVVVKDGLGEVLVAQNINPIMPRRNTGLLFWGESTENPVQSSLSDEHAIITLLRLKRELEQYCQPYFFRINTEALRVDFENGIRRILNGYISTNELYDYAVSMERNTAETIQRKELWCDISIEISKGIEQIYIPIHVVATGSISGS